MPRWPPPTPRGTHARRCGRARRCRALPHRPPGHPRIRRGPEAPSIGRPPAVRTRACSAGPPDRPVRRLAAPPHRAPRWSLRTHRSRRRRKPVSLLHRRRPAAVRRPTRASTRTASPWTPPAPPSARTNRGDDTHAFLRPIPQVGLGRSAEWLTKQPSGGPVLAGTAGTIGAPGGTRTPSLLIRSHLALGGVLA